MKVNRYLKKIAQEDLKSIETDSDREFLLWLENSVEKKEVERKNVNTILYRQTEGEIYE